MVKTLYLPQTFKTSFIYTSLTIHSPCFKVYHRIWQESVARFIPKIGIIPKNTSVNHDPLNSTTMGILSGLTTVHWDEIGGPPLMGPFIRWWNTLKYWRETWWMLLEAMLFSSQKFSICPNFPQYIFDKVYFIF